MGVFRPVGFLILIIMLVFLGSYLIGADQMILGQIFMGTAVFLFLAGVALIFLARYDRRATQQQRYESRLLYFFRRWLMRVDGRDYDYLKFKFRDKDVHKRKRAYLEEFKSSDLAELRLILSKDLTLSDLGVFQRTDGKPVDPEQILSALENLGWDLYYLRRATSSQYYAYYYFKREMVFSI